ATGLMLGLLKLNNFYNLEGLELSKWACNEAKKNFNLDIQNVDIYDAKYPSEYFDLIISNHVIEHLKDPLQAFIKINQFLKTGGLLFLSTPNGSCLNSRIVKAKWRHFIPEEHLYLFNKKSIKIFLGKIGFKIILLKFRLYSDDSLLNYLKQLTMPILIDYYRRIIKNQGSLNNFITSRDGMIIVAQKIKNIETSH
ncbi:unnamed protein product, partial [marine sediment metagenome]